MAGTYRVAAAAARDSATAAAAPTGEPNHPPHPHRCPRSCWIAAEASARHVTGRTARRRIAGPARTAKLPVSATPAATAGGYQQVVSGQAVAGCAAAAAATVSVRTPATFVDRPPFPPGK